MLEITLGNGDNVLEHWVVFLLNCQRSKFSGETGAHYLIGALRQDDKCGNGELLL